MQYNEIQLILLPAVFFFFLRSLMPFIVSITFSCFDLLFPFFRWCSSNNRHIFKVAIYTKWQFYSCWQMQ